MSFLTNIYLRTSRHKFKRAFRPTKIHRNDGVLLHIGNKIQFMKSALIVHMIKKSSDVVLVSHSSCSDIVNILSANFHKVIYYGKTLKVLSHEHGQIARSLSDSKFQFLFELGAPANISIPYLSNIDQRICIGDRNLLPYYNIIFDSPDALIGYFKLKSPAKPKLFNFSKNKIKEIQKKHNLDTSYIVVNGSHEIKSEQKKVTIGKDIGAEDPEVYAIIMGSNAYTGGNDHFAEFARINNITIID
jgi:hypothetical protein